MSRLLVVLVLIFSMAPAFSQSVSVRPVALSNPKTALTEKITKAYNNTGIVFSERSADGSLLKATGTVVKTVGNNYSILTVKHAIFDKKGNRFASRLIFTTEEKPSRPPFIIDISSWVKKIEPYSDHEDYFFIPIKEEDAIALGVDGLSLSFLPDLSAPFFLISSQYDKTNARIDKSIKDGVNILPPKKRRAQLLSASNLEVQSGMCGAPILQHSKNEKLVFLGILNSECDCTTKKGACAPSIVRP